MAHIKMLYQLVADFHQQSAPAISTSAPPLRGGLSQSSVSIIASDPLHRLL